MAVVLRIILLLLPVVVLIYWLRWRARKKAQGELSDEDVRALRLVLVAAVITLLAGGLTLRFLDDSGSPKGIYVPARVENGVLIPGHFKDDAGKEKVGDEDVEDPDDSEDAPS